MNSQLKAEDSAPTSPYPLSPYGNTEFFTGWAYGFDPLTGNSDEGHAPVWHLASGICKRSNPEEARPRSRPIGVLR